MRYIFAKKIEQSFLENKYNKSVEIYYTVQEILSFLNQLLCRFKSHRISACSRAANDWRGFVSLLRTANKVDNENNLEV